MTNDPDQLPPRNDEEQHDAHRQVQVLGTHLEAQGQAETQHADHQRSQRRPDDRAFPAGREGTAQNDRGNDGQGIR